jgi:hypothetical protein
MPKETKTRRAPNLREKLASALLNIRAGSEWLIDDAELRKYGTAKQILAYVQWDHIRRYAEDGDTSPQNLDPKRIADHKEKSRRDNTEIAKGKRIATKEEQFRRNLLVKIGQAIQEDAAAKERKKPKLSGRPFPTPEEQKAIKERYAR